MDELAALLLDGLEGDEWAGRLNASFLLELPLGGYEQIFVGIRFALGDRPRTFVLVGEKGTARMSQEDFEATFDAVHQQTGADSGHGLPISIWP